jgi:hypothetical protein
MSLQAVALVRIPGWEADDDLDVRELEDGALVFLELPFESDPEDVVEALAAAVGPSMLALHDDERGVFVFPDAAEPEDAATYDAVIEAVGEVGSFVALDADQPLAFSQEEAAEALQGALFGTLEKAVAQLGFGSIEELQSLLTTQDPEALKMAQIRMTGMMERAMAPAHEGGAHAPEAAPEPVKDAPSTPEKPKNDG